MMSIKVMHWIGLLIYLSSYVNYVRGQATTDQCRSDDNGGLQTVLLEQTLQALQTMNERQQAMNERLQAVESRLESLEKWVKESDKGT